MREGIQYARWSPLLGPDQTGPRSELSAVLDILGLIPLAQHSHARGLEHPALFGINGDLWSALANALLDRCAGFEITCGKPHATALLLWSDIISREGFIVNSFADAFAVCAADSNQHDESDVQRIEWIRCRVTLIHRSLVAILTDVQEAESKLEAEESPGPPPCAQDRSPSKAWTPPRSH